MPRQSKTALEATLWNQAGLSPRAHHIATGPRRTVRVLDVGEGPPLIMLHAAGMFASTWVSVAALLAGTRQTAGFRLLMLDQPGHGESTITDYSQIEPRAHNVATITAVLDELQIERATFVGNSLGGQVALWTALDAPDRVSELVIVGVPAVAFDGVRADTGLMLLSLALFGPLMLSLPQPRFVDRMFLRGAFGKRAAPHVPRVLYDLHHAFARSRAWRRTLTSLMRRLLSGYGPRREYLLTPEELARIEPPVACLWGDRDVYGSPRVAERAMQHLVGATLDVIPGGHLPHWDDPAWFARMCRQLHRRARSPSFQEGTGG